MLHWRLFSSALIISVLLVSVYFDFQWGQATSWDRQGVLTTALVWVFGILAALELDRLTAPTRFWPQRLTMIFATTFVIVAGCVPIFYVPYPVNCAVGRLGWPVLGGMMGILLAFIVEMVRFQSETTDAIENQAGPVTRRIGLVALSMVYIGLPLALLAQLRQMDSNAFGIWALVSVLVIPKISDAGAYFVGRSFGRNKLIPRVSPGKTIEGAVGGLVMGVLGSLLMWFVIGPYVFGVTLVQPWWLSIVYGLILTIVGMFGDLAESLIKRDCASKDSSHLLPGLGGVLDVIDSILTTTPAAYVFWLVVHW